jgi:hypothetical protein
LHYVVTSLGSISNIEATTCSSFASLAWTFRISLASITRGCVNSSVVVFEDIDLLLNKLNILDDASTKVTVILAPDPASSDTKIDLTTISNLKTGEVYKTEDEWKTKGVPEAEIRRDVKVIMPALDLFPKTK